MWLNSQVQEDVGLSNVPREGLVDRDHSLLAIQDILNRRAFLHLGDVVGSEVASGRRLLLRSPKQKTADRISLVEGIEKHRSPLGPPNEVPLETGQPDASGHNLLHQVLNLE